MTTAAAATTPPMTWRDISPRTASLVAGIGYLVIFLGAIFANFMVLESMVVEGDAAATLANVTENQGMFRMGLIAFLIVFIADLVIAWALWIVFKAVHPELSRLTAWARVLYTVFLGVALIFFFTVLELISGAAWVDAFDQGQIEAQVMLALDAFDAAWLIGLSVFGLHLILLGWMIVRSAIAPRVLGWVLAIAGVAYIVDTVAHGLMSTYADYADPFLAMVAIPSVIGELWFAFWLLLRGGKERVVA